MPANTTPLFVGTPNVGFARLAAANTARDGSGTVATAYTAATYGSRIDRIVFSSAQATAALSSTMVCRIFISDTSGTNYRLYKELAVTGVTASATAIGARAEFTLVGGLIIKSGQLLGATISVYAGVQDQTDVVVEAGDYTPQP